MDRITLHNNYGIGDLQVFWNSIQSVDHAILLKILDSIPSPMFIISANAVLRYCNRSYENILGISCENAYGKSIESNQPDILTGKFTSLIKRLNSDNPGVTSDIPLLCKDGEIHQISILLLSVLFQGEKSIFGIFQNFISISDYELSARTNEHKYRKLFEESNDAILIHDKTGHVLEVNKQATDLFGYSKSEFLSINVSQLCVDKADCSDHIKNIRESYHNQHQLKKKNDQNIFCDISSKIIDEESGIIQTIIRDVTSEHQAKIAVSESEKRYRGLYSAMNEGVALHDIIYNNLGQPIDYSILDANPAYLSIFGFRPEDVIGKKASEIFITDDPPFIDEYYNVIKSGQPYTFETFLEQYEKYFSINVFSPSENQFATIINDITFNVKAQNELKKNKEELQAIFNHTSDGLFILDSEGVILKLNLSACSMLGSQEKHLLGQNFENLILSGQCVNIRQHISAAISNNQVIFEIKHIAADGKIFPAEIRIRKIDLSGKFLFLVTSHNLTDQKKTETTIRHEKEKIETLNRNLEDALLKAQQMAKEAALANSAKSNFLSTITHEVRTPLNGIIGMTDLLRQTDLSNEQSEFCEIINNSSESLMTIMNDILDFSKLDSNKLSLLVNDLDLYDLLYDSTYNLYKKAIEKNLDFEVRFGTNLPQYISGDELRIKQILFNLGTNAIKFTEKGKITIEINTDHINENEISLLFKVTDTGIGISKENRQHLFRAFTQIDCSSTRKYSGTGLGLIIANNLAEIMNGFIDFASTPGKGSTFWFKASFPIVMKKSNQVRGTEAFKKGCVICQNAYDYPIIKDYLTSISVMTEITIRKSIQDVISSKEVFDIIFLNADIPANPTAIATYQSYFPHCKFVRLFDKNSCADSISDYDYMIPKPLTRELVARCLSTLTEIDLKETKSVRGPLYLHVLIIEDNIINQKVATQMLKKLGCSSDVASNGLDAISILEYKRYDLILLDLQMPFMNGYEVIKLIRNENTAILDHNVPVIAMTAFTSEQEKYKCIQAGMDSFITKPLTSNVLKRELIAITQKRYHSSAIVNHNMENAL